MFVAFSFPRPSGRGSAARASHWGPRPPVGPRDPPVLELGEGPVCGAWGHLFRLLPPLANLAPAFRSEEEEVAAGADLDAISSYGSAAPPFPVQQSHHGRVLLL